MYYDNLIENRSFTIEECISHFETVDLHSKEDIIKNAWALKALANNNNLLEDLIKSDLKNGITEFQKTNYYTPQSLILGRGSNFYFRANIWEPQSIEEINNEDTNIYGLCHDHNFSFLTVGYFGPGYGTHIYEYEPSQVKGNVGEKINMKSVGEFRLKKGEVMLYEASKHIHTQIPPKSLSVSINLMIALPEQNIKDQYIIDSKTQKIVDCIGPGINAQEFLIQLASQFGNSSSLKYLKQIYKNFPAARTRRAAKSAYLQLQSRLKNA